MGLGKDVADGVAHTQVSREHTPARGERLTCGPQLPESRGVAERSPDGPVQWVIPLVGQNGSRSPSRSPFLFLLCFIFYFLLFIILLNINLNLNMSFTFE
jgi:hypothetical protein